MSPQTEEARRSSVSGVVEDDAGLMELIDGKDFLDQQVFQDTMQVRRL